jgi:hypothetical protein
MESNGPWRARAASTSRLVHCNLQKTRHRLFFSSWLQGSARNRFVPSFGIALIQSTVHPRRPPWPIGIFRRTQITPSPSIGIALILRRWTPRKRMATNSTDPVAMPATMHSFLMPSIRVRLRRCRLHADSCSSRSLVFYTNSGLSRLARHRRDHNQRRGQHSSESRSIRDVRLVAKRTRQ